MASPPKLTKEQSVRLELELIALYRSEECQTNLRKGWAEAAGDMFKQGKARQEACLPYQFKVIPKYGFLASKKGLSQSLKAYDPYIMDPDEQVRGHMMGNLVNPALQDLLPQSEINLSGWWRLHNGYEAVDLGIVHETGNEHFTVYMNGSDSTGRFFGSLVSWVSNDKNYLGALVAQDKTLLIHCYLYNEQQFVSGNFGSAAWMVRQDSGQDSGKKEELSDKPPPISLEHLFPENPLLYGGRMGLERAPSVFLLPKADRFDEMKALMEYIRDDPEGPFHGVVDDWPQVPGKESKEKGKSAISADKYPRWSKWQFVTGGQKEPLLKADWHSVHNWGWHSAAFIPRDAQTAYLIRSPQRLLAFVECFREVNSNCWTAICTELEKVKHDAERQAHAANSQGFNAKPDVETSDDLPWLIDLLTTVMRKRGHFGSVEAQVWWGPSVITTRSHKDGATSLLHLSLTLSGKRSVRVGSFNSSDAPEVLDPIGMKVTEEDVFQDELWCHGNLETVKLHTGSVYCSNPFVFEHGVEFEKCDQVEPVIALQCRFAFPNLADARKINTLRSKDMLAVTEVVAKVFEDFQARGELRMPTMQEVVDAEKAIAHFDTLIASGRPGNPIFRELPPSPSS